MNGDSMKKSMLFEAVLVLLFIALVFTLYVMVTTGGQSTTNDWTLSGMISDSGFSFDNNMFIGDDGTLYTVDGKNVYAIDPNGHVRWSMEIPYFLHGTNVREWRELRAVTDNGTLYIALAPSSQALAVTMEILAISPNGKLLWGNGYGVNGFFRDMKAVNGSLFLKQDNDNITVIDLSGKESDITQDEAIIGLFNDTNPNADVTYSCTPVSAVNTTNPGYSGQSYVEKVLIRDGEEAAREMLGYRTLDQLDTYNVSAFDVRTGNNLWNCILPIEKHTATINLSNYKLLLYLYDDVEKDNLLSPAQWYKFNNVIFGVKVVNGDSFAYTMPAKDVVYVNLWTCNYEVPTFFGMANCTYAGGIYAIDNNGTLLWYKPTDSRIIAMQEKNGTIYYGTNDGKISSAKVDAATGFALTALLYLFIRFFLMGAVTRARSIIDGNANRNTVLKYIAAKPGASMYDISRNLGINKGTVRYHLMILGANHRIVSCKADDKYIRYFTNAGSYSREQQFIFSMMKREGIRKVLGTLLEKPGLSNVDLSREVGLKESAASRYMKELLEKGIVDKEPTGDGRLSYRIKNVYREPVAYAIERLRV